jgi:hypothetical protein
MQFTIVIPSKNKEISLDAYDDNEIRYLMFKKYKLEENQYIIYDNKILENI